MRRKFPRTLDHACLDVHSLIPRHGHLASIDHMSQITIDLPAAVTSLYGDPAFIAADATMAVAVRLYMTGRLSLGQSSRMVGISTIAFRQRMGEYGGTEFTQSREELAQELIGA